jgi:hypothetical protein
LFSHWKFNDNDIFSNDCKKGEPSTTEFVFCQYDREIDQKLIYLHTIQRAGNKEVQREIDRYLICCRDKQYSNMILQKNCIPHYDNLPDMFYYIVGILDSNMDSDESLQQVLLLLRQCIPLRRRTKRAQREVQWKQESLFSMQTLIRCIQGTLLGLYPTCLNNVAFGARMGIFTFLRSLLVQPFTIVQRAMEKISYIVKIGVMEYLCNVIIDYYPGICHTLNQSGQKVEHFCNTVSSICDIFRGELNTLYCVRYEIQKKMSDGNVSSSQIILGIISQLEKISHSYFERCTRAYRGIIIGDLVTCKHVDLAKKMLNENILKSIGFILMNTYHASNQHVFELIHQGILPQEQIAFAWHLTKIIKVHNLPSCIFEKQLIAMAKRYGGDTICMNKCRVLHICVVCAMKRNGAHGMRLRHDCQNGELLCVNCGQGTVLSIDVLGKIVCIGNDNIIMSSCCGIFIHYGGTGHDFSTTCGVQCSHHRHVFKKKERASSLQKLSQKKIISTSAMSYSDFKQRTCKYACKPQKIKNEYVDTKPITCELCTQKNIVQTLSVLNKKTRSIQNIRLCVKHGLPQQLTNQVLERDDLFTAINKMSLSKRIPWTSFEGPNTIKKSKRGRKPKYSVQNKT